MTPEQILQHPPKVLTPEQRQSYFDQGFLLVENLIGPEWIERLLAVTDEMVERSRTLAQSDAVFDLEPDHTADNPRLRRLTSPVDQHPVYWEFASQSVLADVAADLVGPDIKFHHSKLNFKWSEGGEEVKWHQDITYWPHTNYSPLTIGTYLYDVDDDQGPLAGVAGSHNGPLFDQYNASGQWVGCIAEQDLPEVDLDRVEYMTGPAGSITVHNCRTVHGSKKNLSPKGRPLLLNIYSAADAFPYTANPLNSPQYSGAIVRGQAARWAYHDPRPCLIPPDWSGGIYVFVCTTAGGGVGGIENMAPYKVAIVGTGMIANVGHIPAWLALAPTVEVVGVFNHTLDKAQQTADRHGIPCAYDDCERMMDELRPDIVSVCTPNVSHRTYTEAALQAGAHVFCEKPVAASHADAVIMYAAAEAADRHLFVTQTGRFSGTNTAAKQLADSGHLGEMYYAETSAFRRRGVPTWGRFHIKEASGGGPLYDIGVHALDALLWIMGNPKVVAASGATYTKLADQREDVVTSLADSGAPEGVFAPRDYDIGEYDVEDMAAGFLRLENGATISIRASWAANLPDGTGGTLLMGTKGGLTFNPLTFIGTLGRHQADTRLNVPPDPAVPFSGHWKAAAHFVEVLEGRAELLVKKEEVLNVMAALDGLYRSATEGREVRIS